jgi:glycosyltransferase involved in cell wall biosynthesis
LNTNAAPKITIHTLAYNVEKYIIECVESVLNQTFTDFEWLVLDNGSTDHTGAILEEYACKDDRIKLFKNKRNSFIYKEPMNPDFVSYCINQEFDYWCALDSDDYLHPDFLKELYKIAVEKNADIVVGGTEMFMEGDLPKRGRRRPPNFFTNDITAIGDMLPKIYGSFRPMWGKLVKASVIGKQVEYRSQNPVVLKNGGDTLFCLDLLRFSSSVAGINRVLHYYRIRNDSFFQSQVDKHRYLDHIVIYQESIKLLQNWGKLNAENKEFLARILQSSILDCMQSAVNATSVPLKDRLEVIETILSDETIIEVMKDSELYQKLFLDLQQLINDLFENMPDEDVPIATMHYIFRLYMSLKMANSAEGNKQNAFLLYLSAICDKSNKCQFGAIYLNQLFAFAKKHELAVLRNYGISNEFLASNPILLREIINDNLEQVVKLCEVNSGNLEYDSLKKEAERRLLANAVSSKELAETIRNAKQLIDKSISNEHFDEAVDLLINVLETYPLDKEALCYKIYFLSMNGDRITLAETALTLVNFYPDDCAALTFGAQALHASGVVEEAKRVYQEALGICTDYNQQLEIIRELEAIE